MKEKREKKKWALMVLIIFIMIGTSFSVFFYGASPVNDVAKYNGIKFVGTDNPSTGKIWVARISGIDAAFSFLPSEVESIPSSVDLPKALQNRLEIDVTYDLNSTYKEITALAQHQMELTLSNYNVFVRKGFTSNNSFNMPVITCDDAAQNVPVVYFMEGNSTSIYFDKNCIIAEASSNADFIKVKDKLLYEMLGVMS